MNATFAIPESLVSARAMDAPALKRDTISAKIAAARSNKYPTSCLQNLRPQRMRPAATCMSGV
jgi:hypothetical protein